MRLLSMLLMLCLSLLYAADPQLKCDQSLIKAAPDTIQFDVATKRLTCTVKPNSFMAIHVLPQGTDGNKSKPYPALKCDETDGWKAQEFGTNPNEKIEVKIANASAILNVECVEYCASSGKGNFALEYLSDDRNYPWIVIKSDCNMYYAWREIQERILYCIPYSTYGQESGWFDDDQLLTKDTSTPLPFVTTCRKDPQLPCIVHTVEVAGDRTSDNPKDYKQYQKLNIDLHTRTMTCRGANDNSMKAIRVAGNSKRYVTMQCDEAEGWTSMQSKLEDKEWTTEVEKLAEATSPLEVECVNHCEASGDRIIYKKNDQNAEVSCPDGFKLHFLGQSIKEAKCYQSGKWTLEIHNSDIVEIDSGNATEFECRPTKCYMPKTEGATFDESTKTLTCNSRKDASMAILINSARYSSVVCDEQGLWHGIVGNSKPVILHKAWNLNFACIKYCTTIIPNIQINRTMSSQLISSVRCKRDNFGLFPKGMAMGFNILDCDLQSGWQFNNQNISDDTANPLQLECKEACTQNIRPRDVYYWPESHNGTIETNFKCISHGDKAKIRVNGEMVSPPLKCNIDRGYTDASNATLAGAFEAVKLDCATTGTTATTTTTQSSKTEQPQAQSSVAVVVGSIGGVLLIIVIVFGIFIVLKKRRPENSENGTDKSKGRKGKHRKGSALDCVISSETIKAAPTSPLLDINE